MQINVSVTDANNIVCNVVPPQTQVITIDRGVAGNGIVSIVPVTISTFQYLRITYTNGTVQDVGPLTSTAYTATAPITIVGNTISLSTVPIASGGTGATTAATAIQNLLPSYTGNENKRLGLNSGGTALEWVLDGGGTVTSVAASGGTTGLTFTGSPITTSGTLTLGGTLAVANGGTGVTTSTGTGSVVLSTSPTLVTPLLGTPTSGNFSTGTFTWPTFNQNTTGTAANVTGVVAIANGGTGQTTASAAITALTGTQTSAYYLRSNGTTASLSALSAADLTGTVSIATGGTGANTAATARTNLGATTVGGNVFTLTNPSAITFPRFNADNTVSALDAATFRTAIGAGTSSTTGTVTSVAATVPSFLSISGSPITTSGTLAIGLSGTALPVANGGTGVTTSTGSGNNVLSTSPTLVTPLLGTPTSGVATNLTGLPLTTGVTGTLGTANGGTNLTSFTSGGVVYASSSSALATGSALTFDGTLFSSTVADNTIAVKFKAATSNIRFIPQDSGAAKIAALNAAESAFYPLITQGSSLQWVIDTTEQMRLTSTGLGIGTTTPRALLDISNPSTTLQTTGLHLGYSSVDGYGYRVVNENNPTATAAGLFKIQRGTVGAFVDALVIDNSGNVGIGTSSPTAKLDVNGGALIQGLTVGRGGGAVATNTATGYQALYSNTTGIQNTASGYAALPSNTTGNNNTASGYAALQYNTTGSGNTANGVSALQSNTTGNSNTANGYAALYNTTGNNNTASGYAALQYNTTGGSNTASGYAALQSNTTGGYNTANGQNALYSNTTGGSNTASGVSALYYNTTGTNNTANGQAALQSNTTGSSNTASGYQALNSNTTGSSNTANGLNALLSNTTGVNNTASGRDALLYNTTGSGNTAINPLNSGGGYAPVFDPTTQNNRFCMGSTGVTNAYVQVAWTVVSDARDKTDFAPVPHGLAFVTQLQPTAYRYKMNREDTEGHGPVRYGFKAQEVLALEGNTPVIVDAEDPEKLRFNDQAMIAVLVNAVKELKIEFDLYKSTHP